MRRPRAASFLEFVLLLPFLVAIMMLTLDVGRVVLAISTLQDASSAAARASARVGYAGDVPAAADCRSLSPAPQDIAYDTFCRSVLGMPVGDITGFRILEPRAKTALGHTCDSSDSESRFVRVVSEASFLPLTPGLSILVEGGFQGRLTLAATSVARCEVARR